MTVGVVALLVMLAIGVGIARFRRPPGEELEEYIPNRDFIGVLVERPYPHLRCEDDDGRLRSILLVGGAKSGAAIDDALFGQAVRAQGNLLRRNGSRILEGPEFTVAESYAEVRINRATQVSDEVIGRVVIEGEIVDSKCYFGRMRPGGGRAHRACAQLCIDGGVPPVLVTRDDGGHGTSLRPLRRERKSRQRCRDPLRRGGGRGARNRRASGRTRHSSYRPEPDHAAMTSSASSRTDDADAVKSAALIDIPGTIVPAARDTGTSKKQGTPRVLFIDVMRLIAALQMINGHTLDGVMVESIRQGPFWDKYLTFRGLISVAFLFAAGISYQLSTLSRFDRYRGNPASPRRRLRIVLSIIVIGYLLGFPWGAFSSDPVLNERAWYYFWRVSILQCIGATLLILWGLTQLARKPSTVVAVSGGLAVTIFILAPWCDGLIRDGRPHPLLNWISSQGGSVFPIIPSSGYVFTGVVVGAYVLPRGGHTPLLLTMKRLAVVAVMATVGWWVVANGPISLHDAAVHDHAAAPTFLMRQTAIIAAVSVALAGFGLVMKKLPKLLTILASETLTIYVFHIVLLFYPIIGISRHVGTTLEPPAALGVSALMFVVTIAFTVQWHAWKKRRRARKVARGV